MPFSPLLALYRLAWEPALLAVRAASGAEAIYRSVTGRALWPGRWQLRERLCYGNPQVTSEPETGNAASAIWMHAASLGECKGLGAVAERLSARLESQGLPARFVLTANTVEGRNHLAAHAAGRWAVRLAPLDHPRVVRGFLKAYRVSTLILFEVELWPHFIRETKRALETKRGLGTKRPGRVLWISAQCTRSASRLRAVLPRIDWIQAQSEEDARALRRLGARPEEGRVETGADLRGLHYLGDLLAPAPRQGQRIPWESRAGIALVSLHADELGAIVPALRKIPAAIPVFIFPRKLDELPLFAAALEGLGFSLRSRDADSAPLLLRPRLPLRQIVDAFGLVDETLRRCRVAVLGGSFAPHGGHNLWEPLKAGLSMQIGPHHEGQKYLVEKLATAQLLRTTSGSPDAAEWITLHDAPDPGEACLRFAEEEGALLDQSLESVGRHLSIS